MKMERNWGKKNTLKLYIITHDAISKNRLSLHSHSYFQIDVYAPHNLCVISFLDCSLQVAYKFICCYFFNTFVVIYFSFSVQEEPKRRKNRTKFVLIVLTIKKNCRINFYDFRVGFLILKLNWGKYLFSVVY